MSLFAPVEHSLTLYSIFDSPLKCQILFGSAQEPGQGPDKEGASFLRVGGEEQRGARGKVLQNPGARCDPSHRQVYRRPSGSSGRQRQRQQGRTGEEGPKQWENL